MNRKRRIYICDYCSDQISLDGKAKIKEDGVVKFLFDVGCMLLFEKRGRLTIQGEEYKLIY